MWKNACEVHELLEHIEQRAAFRAAATRNDLSPLAAELYQMFRDDDRLDDKHIMLLEQCRNLVPNCRERGMLDFNQLAAADDIDAVPPNALLDGGPVHRVAFL
jgi:hypothetical protein